MTPDRMVVAEAMRTFTYLNLYGYLTDAVVVNRVFPDELADGYFGAWHDVQQEQLELVESGFAPVPVLRAPYFAQEVIGAERCSTSSATALFAGARRRRACCTTGSRRSCRVDDGARASCGSTCRSPSKGDVSLKKIGLELVVRVDGHKRTIVLPGALARLQADVGDARRRLAGRGVRGWLSPTARPTRRPSGCVREAQCARPRRPRAARAARSPPRGWSAAAEPPRAPRSPTSRRCSRCSTRRAASVPPELARQLADALRELLIALRAVLDYSIERLEPPTPASARRGGHPDPSEPGRRATSHASRAAAGAAARGRRRGRARRLDGPALVPEVVRPQGTASSCRPTCRRSASSRSSRRRSCWSPPAVLFLVWARSQRQALPPAGRRRRRDHAGRRLGAAAARLAAVRQARHRRRRARRSASSGGSSSRCWPPAR